MISICKDAQDKELCKCIDKAIFKNFTYDEYKMQDKNASEYTEFIKETKEECLDDGWF